MNAVPRPRRVAIVGAGPSGLFAAQALLTRDESVRVDIIDRLPTPFGLLRYGVAPDHTSIQAMAPRLAEPFRSERVRFFGVVEFGTVLTRADLLASYDAVIYAAGAAEDRRLGVDGEDLPGSRSAREFVAWYCGHPDAEPQRLAGVRSAMTFGVGNVAVDVARVLSVASSHLAATDMPGPVLDELRASEVADVWLVGRRGPQHASFTTTELRELLTLPGVQPLIDPADLTGIDSGTLDRRTRTNVEAITVATTRLVPDAHTRLHLLFWRRPLRLLGDGVVEAVVLERTALDADGRVVGTGEQETIDVQLVLRAIGYRGRPLPDVPFDDAAGVIPNAEGRVTTVGGEVCPGEYVVGWIKRGPIGVIGTNKSDAGATVAALLADFAGNPRYPEGPGAGELLASRGLESSTFADWERIDAEERARGTREGRARVKVASWHQLTDLLRHGRGGGPLEREPDATRAVQEPIEEGERLG